MTSTGTLHKSTASTDAINVGTGRGYSVMEMIAAFRAASGRDIPWRLAPRRAGDIGTSVADPARAAERLDWRARRGLEAMCADAWAWTARGTTPDQTGVA